MGSGGWQESGMRGQLEEAARAARGRAGGWTQICQCLGGRVRQMSMTERAAGRREREEMEEEAARTAKAAETAEAAAAAAEAAAAAAEGRNGRGGAQVGGDPGLTAAACTLEVAADAERGAVRKAYLRKALRTHPDRGGEKSAFQELESAFQLMSKNTGEERRRRMAGGDAGSREAGEAAGEAGRSATVAAAAAEVAAAAAKAVAEWQPASAKVAHALREGERAYTKGWEEYQRQVRRMREERAREAGYETHKARGAEEARVRRDAPMRHSGPHHRRMVASEIRMNACSCCAGGRI